MKSSILLVHSHCWCITTSRRRWLIPSTVQHGPPCLLLKIVGEKHGENSRNLMRKQKDPKIWKSVFRLKEMENLGFHPKNQDLEVQKIHENPGYAKSQLAKKKCQILSVHRKWTMTSTIDLVAPTWLNSIYQPYNQHIAHITQILMNIYIYSIIYIYILHLYIYIYCIYIYIYNPHVAFNFSENPILDGWVFSQFSMAEKHGASANLVSPATTPSGTPWPFRRRTTMMEVGSKLNG